MLILSKPTFIYIFFLIVERQTLAWNMDASKVWRREEITYSYFFLYFFVVDTLDLFDVDSTPL